MALGPLASDAPAQTHPPLPLSSENIPADPYQLDSCPYRGEQALEGTGHVQTLLKERTQQTAEENKTTQAFQSI